eukprot:TRINITY_DN14457_c0_g2_i1.p1 TRINITY_DN14457_c0_g2~~TRINITY_DN14457_c0_g2_i1.p1  ORF type:complete len:1160 (+),score=317.83 TRINITY_DN14457_c0_g2_i1:474-3482(+)
MDAFPNNGLNDSNFDDFRRGLATRVWAAMNTTLERGTGGLGCIHLGTGHGLVVHESFATITNPPDGLHVLVTSQAPGAPEHNLYYGTPLPDSGDLSWDLPCCEECILSNSGVSGACFRYSKDQRTLVMPTMGSLPWFKIRVPRFTPLGSVDVAVGISTTASWGLPGSDVKRGVCFASTDLRQISTRFEQETAAASAAGAFVRLYTLVARDILYEELGPQLAAMQGYESQVGRLIGVSHGESAYWFTAQYDGDGCMDPTCQRRGAAADWNATDHMISETAKTINMTYSKLVGSVTSITVSRSPGAVPDVHYVGVHRVQLEGLDWFVVGTIDRQYILGTVTAQIAQVEADIEAEDRKLEDDREQDRMVMLLIVAGAVLVLFLVTYLFVLQVNRPLRTLMREMVFVSHMQLDRVDESRPLSGLDEVKTMEESFRQMIVNLREFRKYMPASILDDHDDDDGHELVCGNDVEPPPSGNVTLVFTDIRGSTSLWEQATEAMGVALKQHNNIIRKAIAQNGGYEVKTVGDAFFVVFASPEDACRFGVQVQADLTTAEWDRELAECGLPQAAQAKIAGSDEWLWNGVRIRIGIHFGRCEMEVNPTTGRADYFGPPVNIAARLEAAGVGGFVGVSDTVAASVGEATLQSFAHTVPMGKKELKGVGKPVELLGLLPKGLEGRTAILDADGKEKKVETSANQEQAQVLAGGPRGRRNQVQDRLKTSLAAARGAVAQVCAPLRWEDDVGSFGVLDAANRHVAAAELAAERSEGILQSAFGSQILVTWNCGRRCASPQDQAAQFVLTLHKRFGHHPQHLQPHVGLAGGVLLHGNIGGQGRSGRRFATVIGGTVELACVLSTHAKHLKSFALAARIRSSQDQRPVARWMHVDADEPVIVYEIKLTESSEDDFYNSREGDAADQEAEHQPWTSSDYVVAFEANDFQVMKSIAERRPTDTVLCNVAQHMRSEDAVKAWWLTGVQVPIGAANRQKDGSVGTGADSDNMSRKSSQRTIGT